MKRTFYLVLGSIAIALGLVACEDGSTGSILSQSQVDVVMDSSFTVTGQTILNEKIQSRTTNQLLGIIKADNYGELSSDFVTQFMPSVQLDTTGVTVNSIDSVKLVLRIPNGGYVGDSITPMRLSVYKLNKQLASPIYSNLNPSEYYSKSDLMGSTSYTASAIMQNDTIKGYSYREVNVTMPLSFGRNFFTEFKNNPSTFATPTSFAKYFPGVYVTTTYGNGRVMHIENTVMKFYYRKTMPIAGTTRDTTYYVNTDYLASTPEVINNNNIKLNISKSIKTEIDNGATIIQAPAGLDVTLEFPVQALIDKYKQTIGNNLGVINNVYFEIPAESFDTKYNIDPPQYLLLVKASEKEKFFANNSITNNVSSYYASYSANTKSYIFSDLRSYLLDIINEKNGIATPEDSKLVLTPVSISTETNQSTGSTTITNIAPFIDAPAIAKLDLKKAKIRITFSKQSLNN